MSENISRFKGLPDDLIIKICSSLDYQSLKISIESDEFIARAVNLSSAQKIIWLPLLNRYFPGEEAEDNVTNSEKFKTLYNDFLNKVSSYIYNDVKLHPLYNASEELKNDREFILAAVTQCGRALEYASEELKNNREIVLAAVTQYGWALQHASEELKNNREFILAAVTQCGAALRYASEELKNNREIVLAAVTQDDCGWALKYASEELKNNREIVLAADHPYLYLALQHSGLLLIGATILAAAALIGAGAISLATSVAIAATSVAIATGCSLLASKTGFFATKETTNNQPSGLDNEPTIDALNPI